jgi:hypothetical protein
MSIVPAVTIETRQRLRGDLFPPLGRKPRHEHVVRAGELPADLGHLLGRLAFRQHDLREAHPS